MALTANEVYRDFVTDGVPSSGAWKPLKKDIRELLTGIAGGGSGIYDFIPASNTGAGTANAIKADTDVSLPATPYGALIAVNVYADNTSSPVTVQFNDGAVYTIKTNSGNDPAVGGLVSGSVLAGYITGSTFRLISDQASAAIEAAAEAAQGAAEDARDAAQNAVPTSYAADRSAMADLATGIVNSVLKESGFFGDFVLVDKSDYSDLITAGATGEVIESTTDLTKAWVRRRTPDVKSVDFKAFGATGGSTDDTALWNALVTRLSSSTWDAKEVIVPPGDFTLHQAALASNMAVKFIPGSRILQPASGTAQTTAVFDASGSLGTGYAINSNSAAGIDYVGVASGVGTDFVPGEYVLMQDDDYVFTPAVAGRNQEIMRVKSVDSIHVYFDKPLTTGFTTANNAKIYHLTPLLNLRVSGEGEVVIGTNQGAGFKLTYGVNSVIERGLLVRNARGGGSYWFNTCFNTHLREATALDAQTTSGGTGYGISMNESCTYCTAESNHFENLRENTYTNRTRHCTFRNNTAVEMVDTGWNTHGAGAEYNICEGNYFSWCAQGVAVGWGGATRADSYNVVRGNRIEYCTNGVSLSGNSTGPLLGLYNVVEGNQIENTQSGTGILASQQTAFLISGNQVYNSPLVTAGINVSTGCTAGTVTGNTVKNLTLAAAVGIRVSAGSNNVAVSHNTVQQLLGATALSYYVPTGSTSILLHANTDLSVTGRSVAGATEKYNSWN